MKERGYGRVIFTSSGSGLFGQPNSPGYVAAKAGVLGLMNSLAYEGREHGVLANTIAPIAHTRMTAAAFGPQIEHMTRPELVSALVVYLASPRCQLTKQAIEVGAGAYARVFIGRTEGITLDTDREIEPELIAERMPDIVDTQRFTVPDDTMEVLTSVFGSKFLFGGAHLND